MPKIAVIPGDGIGVDVIVEAKKVLRTVADVRGVPLEMTDFDYGVERYLQTGLPMPEGAEQELARNFDAILLGAVGDPRAPFEKYASQLLFGLRFGLDLYVNLRPVKLLDARLCPLKDVTENDLNFVVFRENTEGAYSQVGGSFKVQTSDEVSIGLDINTRKGVQRIIEQSFAFARKKGLTRVCMSDKSNALPHAHGIWQRVFQEVSAQYPEIETSHLFVDALTAQMVKRPQQFQVVVTCNLFGDIVTDLGAQLQGGLGLAASGNINPGVIGMFEPVHGSAPKYAGKNIANPLGAILTSQLMLEHLGYEDEGALIERAVVQAIREDQVPAELGGKLGTKETGDYVCAAIRKMGS